MSLLKTKNNGKSLIADVRLWTRAAAHDDDDDDIKKESPKTLYCLQVASGLQCRKESQTQQSCCDSCTGKVSP